MSVVCGIVLAAGKSVRMGAQKLLLPFGGQTIIGHIMDQVGAAVDHLYVVVSHRSDLVSRALEGKSVVVVTNPDPQGDMLSSVRTGLRSLPGNCQAVLVALGDQPAIQVELIERMVSTFEVGKRGIVVPVYNGKRGHPILFSSRYIAEISAGYDGVGLRGLLEAHPDQIDELPASSPSVLSDMDKPEDYQRELARRPGRS